MYGQSFSFGEYLFILVVLFVIPCLYAVYEEIKFKSWRKNILK
jgi:hypothetical protein